MGGLIECPAVHVERLLVKRRGGAAGDDRAVGLRGLLRQALREQEFAAAEMRLVGVRTGGVFPHEAIEGLQETVGVAAVIIGLGLEIKRAIVVGLHGAALPRLFRQRRGLLVMRRDVSIERARLFLGGSRQAIRVALVGLRHLEHRHAREGVAAHGAVAGRGGRAAGGGGRRGGGAGRGAGAGRGGGGGGGAGRRRRRV